MAAAAAVLLAGVAGSEFWRQMTAGPSGFSWSEFPWMAAISVVTSGGAIAVYLLDVRKRQFLALRSRDVFWRRRGQTDQSIPWETIRYLRASRFTESVYLRAVDGSEREIPRLFWPKAISIEEFGEIVQERWLKVTGREALAA